MSYEYSKMVAGLLPASARTGLSAGTPAMAGAPYALRRGQDVVVEGEVLRACPTTYNTTVITPYGKVSCSVAGEAAADMLGASTATLPRPGSRVIVYLPQPGATSGGVIIATLPRMRRCEVAGREGGGDPVMFLPEINYEGGTLIEYHPGYTGSAAAKSWPQSSAGGGSRPHDVLPGDYAIINAQQVGLYVNMLTAGLIGGQRAHISVSMVDDTVKCIGGTFKVIGPAGTRNTYNDEGYVTDEEAITSYQAERAGQAQIGAATTNKSGTPGRFTSIIKGILRRIVPRNRLQIFKGYLGDIINVFVGNPDPSAPLPLTDDAKTIDHGLFHAHVDSSGRLYIRAANGICFERSDSIPVPKRTRQPWDPEGDKGVAPSDDKLDFEWNEEHPYGRSLLLRDANAWRARQAYLRMMDYEKDIYVPEEGDMPVPADNYDPLGRGSSDFTRNAGRRAYFNVEPDGSIIMRDAWGSEIIMRGGNIILNAAGNIEARAGKTVVNMGGQDVVIKAHDSVDVTAEAHDVRIIAKRNLHARSESVLVESTAEHTAVSAGDGVGEDHRGFGIVLQAPTARILANARVVHLAGHHKVLIDTAGGTDGTSDSVDDNIGELQVVAGGVKVDALDLIRLGVRDNAQVSVTPGALALAAGSMRLVADTGMQISRNGKELSTMWMKYKDPPYPPLQELMAMHYELARYSLVGAVPSERAKLGVTYRTPAQYGTTAPAEIGVDATGFRIYQPAWEFLLLNNADGVRGTTTEWGERSIAGTYPWPGAGVRDACYIRLGREVNVTTKDGKAVNRKDMEVAGGDFEVDSMDTLTSVR